MHRLKSGGFVSVRQGASHAVPGRPVGSCPAFTRISKRPSTSRPSILLLVTRPTALMSSLPFTRVFTTECCPMSVHRYSNCRPLVVSLAVSMALHIGAVAAIRSKSDNAPPQLRLALGNVGFDVSLVSLGEPS